MDSPLQELYQAIILEHNRHPRHAYAMENATHQAKGYNPNCGDDLQVFLRIQNDTITDISFQGKGCAISTASASLMTEKLLKQKIADAQQFSSHVQTALREEGGHEFLRTQGDLAALDGVKKFPMRLKCATLAWHAFDEAIAGQRGN
ncbi:MAG: SUF system NifU family Fe-S cluster assembly protein [Puniceicoccales bacterium]|jgi:nitrogen fixation NifU-like protein|nr:SUF system NifU family Fe-S cluster assembly protein [Puniceicoccales bacterium]